jgi:hypothetical protein
MKRIKSGYWMALAIAVSILAYSCSKETTTVPGGASLTLVNTIVGSKPLVANFDGGNKIYYNNTVFKVSYGTFSSTNQLSSYIGDQHLVLREDTLASSRELLNLKFNIPVGSINSLLLVGTNDAPDTLFIKENIPYYNASETVAGIRFINLSPGSTPVSVNIQGKPNGSELSSLSYKSRTAFIRYPATSDVTNYVFEFRNALTGALIASYTAKGVGADGLDYAPNNWLYRNNTLALIGSPGGTGANVQKVIDIKNF